MAVTKPLQEDLNLGHHKAHSFDHVPAKLGLIERRKPDHRALLQDPVGPMQGGTTANPGEAGSLHALGETAWAKEMYMPRRL